jgi:FkbM family methyltransferase
MEAMKSAKKHNDLIYDVGMHKGEDTGFYLSKGFKVIAFEADPEHINYNKNKFSENIEKKELVIVEGAIVDKPISDKVAFYKNTTKSDWGTVDAKWAKRNEILGTENELIQVDVVDFSECIERYGMPYYMKIDIEGADTLCLERLLEFDHKPEFISIESNKTSYEGVLEEVSLLERLGYGEFMAVQQQDIHLQDVPNPPREGVYVPHTFPLGSSGLFGKELQGKWKSKEDILKEYRTILNNYHRFGDNTFWQQNKIARGFLNKVVSSIIGKPIPGWFDIHAKHSSAAS